MKPKGFLSISDLSSSQIWEVFELAKKLKKELKGKGQNKELLKNKSLAMIFEKPSLRTRLSFETAMTNLGGNSVYLTREDIGFGERESIEDMAMVISSMADALVLRTSKHLSVETFAKNSTIPVINALSDVEHPCQALADFMTIWEIKNKLRGLTIAYVGDGENNICHSLVLGCAILGANFKCGSPKGYFMSSAVVKQAKKLAQSNKTKIIETEDPIEAVKNTDVVYTDTWVSMGDVDKEKRVKIFNPYQVNKELLSFAKKDAIFMHDLPAYRGNEVTSDIIDGKQSVVFQEAENRLHVQKALLIFLIVERLAFFGNSEESSPMAGNL